MSIKAILNTVTTTVTTATNEFKRGFNQGYEDVTTDREEDADVIMPSFTDKKPTLTYKVSNTLGLVIGYLAKFFKRPLVRNILRITGITAAVVAIILNPILIGTPINTIMVCLPLAVIAINSIRRMCGSEIGSVMHLVEAFSVGMTLALAFISVIGNLIAGSLVLALACVGLYVVPFMSYIK